MRGLARRLIRSPMFLLAFTLVTFSLFAIAFAQGTPSSVAITFENIRLAASNPLTMAGIIITAVADVRGWWKNTDGSSKVDGVVMVTVLAVVLGAALGTFFQLIGWLAVSPFSTWATPWGGITYGAAMGIGTRIGFNVIDLFLKRNAQHSATATNSGNPPTPSQ